MPHLTIEIGLGSLITLFLSWIGVLLRTIKNKLEENRKALAAHHAAVQKRMEESTDAIKEDILWKQEVNEHLSRQDVRLDRLEAIFREIEGNGRPHGAAEG